MNMSSETELTGKRSLVTGGTRGIGEAIVERLRRGGGTVITTARAIGSSKQTSVRAQGSIKSSRWSWSVSAASIF
jgi:NAD(P)-dependent dehydrogenase (short-subunit alcohol dehydrogenase family)